MELYYNISFYLDLESYIKLYSTSKELNILLKNIPYYIQKEYCLKKLKMFPEQLLELFDPVKLYKIPIVDLKNRVGFTHYIDFITYEYFNNTNIIRGIDCYNRPFISFYYKISKSDQITENVITLFQRYSDDKYSWTTGGDEIPNYPIDRIYFENENEINNKKKIFTNLFNNGKVEYEYEDWHDKKIINVKLDLI